MYNVNYINIILNNMTINYKSQNFTFMSHNYMLSKLWKKICKQIL